MALVGTRTVVERVGDLPEASDFGFIPSSLTITSVYWDHPDLGKKVTLLIDQTCSTINVNGEEVGREVEHWNYETASEYPTWHRKDTYQLAWIPGVNHRASLILVQTEYTEYWYDSPLPSGTPCSRRLTEGYVVYNLAPTEYVVDATGKAKLDAKGQKVPAGPVRKVPGTQRAWDAGITQQGIVEAPDENQCAYWERIELEQEIVREDMQRTVRWSWKHDYLTGLTTSSGPDESVKDPLSWELPIKPDAPRLSLRDPAAGATALLLEGGDAHIRQQFPVLSERTIRCASWVIFRRATVPPTVTGTDDRFDLKDTKLPTTCIEGPVTLAAAVDYAGAPASPVPAPISYSEPEDPTPDPAPSWEQVAEVENTTAADAPGPSRGIFVDDTTEGGATYEYYAVATLGTEGSDDSNHVTAACPAAAGVSALKVATRSRTGGGMEIVVTAPPDPCITLPEIGGIGDVFGDTEVYDIPAALSSIDGVTGWESGLLTKANDLGKAVGLATLSRETTRMVADVDTVPLLMIQRGQLVRLPALTHDVWGNGIHLTTEVTDVLWCVQGFQFKASRRGAGFESTCTLNLEQVV